MTDCARLAHLRQLPISLKPRWDTLPLDQSDVRFGPTVNLLTGGAAKAAGEVVALGELGTGGFLPRPDDGSGVGTGHKDEAHGAWNAELQRVSVGIIEVT